MALVAWFALSAKVSLLRAKGERTTSQGQQPPTPFQIAFEQKGRDYLLWGCFRSSSGVREHLLVAYCN
jgi:hypothetical protein